MVRLCTTESRPSTSSLYPHPLQADTHRSDTYSCFQSHDTWVQGIIILHKKLVLNGKLVGNKRWLPHPEYWSKPYFMNRTSGEAVTDSFVLAHIIFVWLSILLTSFMAASDQDILMSDKKELTDGLINKNLVCYFYCDMPCFGILEEAGI